MKFLPTCPKIVLFGCVLIGLSLFCLKTAYGQFRYPVGSLDTEVRAAVGEFYLSLSGYISPYSTVVLTSDDIFLRSGVADKAGNFYISDVLIKRGFSHFCLTAIDFYRLGESTTCFTIPPAEVSVSMKDIFLPPTLGLSRSKIAAGARVQAFGYTMPGAYVRLHLSSGKVLETRADNRGYYVFTITGLPAGKYQLYATANFNSIESLSPSKKALLLSLSSWDQFWDWLRKLWEWLLKILTGLGLGPLWFGLPLLALITYFVLRIWPEKFTFIYEHKLLAFLPKPEKKLHHFWMSGVGF